jgi:hypothetical protein
MRTSSAGPIAALALLLGWLTPVAVHAEIISVPPAAPSDPATALPPPTVLRGSPPATVKPVPICPPGYTVTPDYGCVAPGSGDYNEGGLGNDYWPDYGFGYPFGAFSGFGFNRGRAHRFAGFHNGHGFHRKAGFRNVAKFTPHGAGMGHIGGFGHR